MNPTTINFSDAVSKTFAGNITGYTLPQIILAAVNLLFGLASIGAFITLLWGSVQWILAGGDKEGLDKAKKKIMGALVGLALVFSVYAMGQVINILFRVNIFEVCIPGINRTCGTSSTGSQQVDCRDRQGNFKCSSNADGSEALCYNQQIPGTPNTQAVFCGSGGFRCDPGPCVII